MKIGRILATLLLIVLIGCAQVPKESVELSATVGRDIAKVYRAHRELAVIFYRRIKNDINKFVDEVYAPYQIQKLLESDQKRFKQGNQLSLFAKLNVAVQQPGNTAAQKTALSFMEVFVQELRTEIENYRKDLLDPVLEQEKELLSAIDRSYFQIHYANSIVTGHLASIVKVHDAQDEILKQFGVEGLREDVGETLAKASDEVAKLVEKGKKVEEKLGKANLTVEQKTEKLRKAFEGFKKSVDKLFKSKKNQET